MCLKEHFSRFPKLVFRGEHASGAPKTNINDSYKLVTNERGEEWMVVFEPELAEGFDPIFQKVFIPLSKLCSGDMNAPLRFSLYLSRVCDNHKYKGEFQITGDQLLSGPANFTFLDTTANNSPAEHLQMKSIRIVK